MRASGWRWLTQREANRLANLDRQGLRPVSDTPIDAEGTVVHLKGCGLVKGYGLAKVFKIVSPDGDIAYWATGDLEMDQLQRLRLSEWSWSIENCHRGLERCCGVEKAQVRSARGQRNHIGLAIHALLRLDHHFCTTGVSRHVAKAALLRDAIRAYVANPLYNLPATA